MRPIELVAISTPIGDGCNVMIVCSRLATGLSHIYKMHRAGKKKFELVAIHPQLGDVCNAMTARGRLADGSSKKTRDAQSRQRKS